MRTWACHFPSSRGNQDDVETARCRQVGFLLHKDSHVHQFPPTREAVRKFAALRDSSMSFCSSWSSTLLALAALRVDPWRRLQPNALFVGKGLQGLVFPALRRRCEQSMFPLLWEVYHIGLGLRARGSGTLSPSAI